MPSALPSTFASAAAGSNNDTSASRNRTEGGGFAEWSRRPNGSTHTFRRTSSIAGAQITAQPSQQREANTPSQTPTASQSSNAYIPPHASRNGGLNDTRYSKAMLLDLFKEQKLSGELSSDVSDLAVGDWHSNLLGGGDSSRWNRRADIGGDGASGPEICYLRDTTAEPLGLVGMTDEERELFTTSVNSPLKGPEQRQGPQREGSSIHRKLSIGQNQGSGLHGLSSPTATTRHQQRRRETGDFQRDSIASPTSSRFFREESSAAEPPPSLIRRRTDLREAASSPITEERDRFEESAMQPSQQPFGTIKRSASNQFSGSLQSPSSPWSSAAPGGTILGGLGSFGSLGTAAASDKRPGFARGESRFRNLMSRDGQESPSIENKVSFGSFRNVNDITENDTQSYTGSYDAFSADGNRPSGSAALGGDSPLQSGSQNDAFTQQSSVARGLQNSAPLGAENQEPLSPTFTNPYSSPDSSAARLKNLDMSAVEQPGSRLHGLGGAQADSMQEPHSAFGEPTDRQHFYDQRFDRNQGSLRGFSSLAGLGGPGPSDQWSAGPIGREKGGFDSFGGSNMRSSADLQSPSLAGLGGNPFGSVGRGSSRLGSLFPSAMQEQMRAGDHGLQSEDYRTSRETDSPSRSGRGKFDDFFKPADMTSEFETDRPSSSAMQQGVEGPDIDKSGRASMSQQMHSHTQSSSAGQPPTAQQKTMVMPDRIRWIYRDPQGNTQGPWSGLEMHDWYRAGFFSPELLVKKVEDPEYEPLAQLIRRIGNSREPFLVPQIGIPGPPTNQTSTGWPPSSVTTGATAAGAQPPFASSFPSFGTTLTAEQQNALERRKQEEQYLMARQKEHLAQQQALLRQMQISGHQGSIPQQLQHASSAHSLHSQPSYGSMTPPSFPQQNMQSPTLGMSGFPSHFDYSRSRNLGSGGETLGHIQEEPSPNHMNHMDTSAGGPGSLSQFDNEQQQRAEQILLERAQLELEQKEADRRWQQMPDERGNERLQQFQDFRNHMEEARQAPPKSVAEMLEAQTLHEASPKEAGMRPAADEHSEAEEDDDDDDDDDDVPTQPASGLRLSLTEQVQKAASAKDSPQPQSPWAKVDAGIPMPLPPPQSRTPLPAPAAQRSRASVADALAAESSQSASPAVETPSASIAPWARDPADTQKQPSLREIQELEARQAAKQGEVAAAARRAALEKELAVQTQQSPMPGLPSSSTWGKSDSPATPTASAWSKAGAQKVAGPTLSATKTKTLQQIQAEEEARKKKSASNIAAASAAAISTTTAAQLSSAGKRYADLASKGPQPSAATTGGGAWHTVGSGGKAKLPNVPASASPVAGGRAVSGSATATLATRPKPVATHSTSSLHTAQAAAHEEFRKWAVAQLRPQLSKGVQVDEFVSGLLELPADTDIITEAVHSVSSTLDSRHFAEEFLRKRALAEKGRTEPGNSSSANASADSKNGGGWSEVARKGPVTAAAQKDESNAFKIVAAKKKSGKR